MRVLRALYTIVRTILTIVIVGLLAIILTQRISNNKMAVAGFRIFTVATESMTPEYLVGDTILVKTVNPEELKVGDDITYLGQIASFKDRIVTHRIIDKKKNENGGYTLVTKGVANQDKDPEINETQVYGKVIYKIKTISYLNGIIGNLYGMYFVIVVPLAIILFTEFMGYKKDKEEELIIKEKEKHKNEGYEDNIDELEENDVNDKKAKRKKRRNKRRQKKKEKEDN